ncbi:hypothetical protein [Halorussus sp. MSC15.2]|uniref:VNG_1110C family protein n=1 Tax=Halorussus sp. MSC15.2 TaxID=2283638 RepID=UPI0035C92F49
MPDPTTLRDSTQFVLPAEVLAGFREDLDEQFTLTFFEVDASGRGSGQREGSDATGATGGSGEPREGEREDAGDETSRNDGYVRVIGSPVEIKAASEFLSRHGVSVR